MDHHYFQGLVEESNLCGSTSALGSFQHSAYDPPFPPISWSTCDPTLLLMNDHPSSIRVKIPLAGNLGADTGRDLTLQRPQVVQPNSQFRIRTDMMMDAIGNSFPFGVDVAAHAQWMQMCSLSSDDNVNGAMPQLVSDFATQQPCMYTSSSDGLHEADSSASSEKDGPLSYLGGSSSDEINWRNSDVLQGNLGGSLFRLPFDKLPEDSSSVAGALDTLDSSSHALSSLVSMPGPALEAVALPGAVSWMSPSTIELGNGSMVTSVVNQHIPSLDPFGGSLGTHGNGAQPYKRQRASYTSEYMANTSLSHPPVPSLSNSMSTRTIGSDYPMTSLNITNALYRDFHVNRRQTPSLPKRGVCEAVGGLPTKSDHLGYDPRSQRKQNGTSVEPQSVAARHRRKKISERVRVLEKLIPGGNKMDTASMLDESIEYVKFLQLQVQLLESLGDMSENQSTLSTPSFYKENKAVELEGFDTKTGSFGSHASQSCTPMHQVRSASSPLILSEILQQQLFKQKLCLVALRQCPPAARSSASGTYA